MMTVAVLCGYYLPGYKIGGPVRSLANLVERLGDEVKFAIITSDRDLGDPAPYPNVRIDAWNECGKACVYYSSTSRRTARSLVAIILECCPDILYLNSFFSPRYTIRTLLMRKFGVMPRIPVIVAPRGEFSPGALSIKPLKKRIYILAARLLRLYSDVLWQASTQYEVDDIRRQFGKRARIAVVPNLPCPGPAPRNPTFNRRKTPGRLQALFLSRISPMKNLYYALNVLSGVRSEVTLDIFGPLEDRVYWEMCRAAIESLPANVSIRYRGGVDNSAVPDVMADHDILILPTRGESFGHVIVEALCAGCPVLISDQTPWRNLEEAGAGWDVPLERPERFAEVIDACAGMDETEFHRWSENARKLGLSICARVESLEQSRRLFRMAAKATNPAC